MTLNEVHKRLSQQNSTKLSVGMGLTSPLNEQFFSSSPKMRYCWMMVSLTQSQTQTITIMLPGGCHGQWPMTIGHG